MSITRLLQPPGLWLVIIESLLLLTVAAVGWHVWQERVAAGHLPSAPHGRTSPVRGGSQASAAGQPGVASPQPIGATPRSGPTPGIGTDAAFLSRQLSELNRVEATFEDLEWRLTKAVVDAIQGYAGRVVIPSIERSEGGQR